MPDPLDVENQRFAFRAPWTAAFKYDDTDFYRKEVNGLQGEVDGTTAVDVVALHPLAGLLLLEAKDFRGHRIENRRRIGGEVAVEVAIKVRDTVAALVGAARKPVKEFPSEDVAVALRRGSDVRVVLWIEDDRLDGDPHRAKQQLSALNGVLKSKLGWLNCSTFVLSSCAPNRINHLTVTNLPGVGQPPPAPSAPYR